MIIIEPLIYDRSFERSGYFFDFNGSNQEVIFHHSDDERIRHSDDATQLREHCAPYSQGMMRSEPNMNNNSSRGLDFLKKGTWASLILLKNNC